MAGIEVHTYNDVTFSNAITGIIMGFLMIPGLPAVVITQTLIGELEAQGGGHH